MRLIKPFIAMILCLSAALAFANVEQYFSSIKNDPKKLYHFFKTMPKGGDLHYHLDGGAPPETMLSVAPLGHYCLNTLSHTVSEALTVNTKPYCNGILLNQLPKNSNLYNEIINSWSMKNFTPGDETGHDHFFASFHKFSPIVSKFAPELLTEVIMRAANQHELYLEVMVIPDDAHSSLYGDLIKNTKNLSEKKKILLNNPKFQANIDLTIKKSKALIDKTQQQLQCQSISPSRGCSVTTKLQYVILREQPLDNFFAQALNGFAAVNQSTDLIGINIVQAEDGAISLRDYHYQMAILKFLHLSYPQVHMSLHAGELISGNVGSRVIKAKELRYHIHDALLTGHAERIGHGVDIHYERDSEEILNYMAKHNIPVEINLTSNKHILNVSGDIHPIKLYLRHGVPVVLSTDDEGILRTNLSREYVKAVIQQNLDYKTIKTINRNALTYNFLPGKSLWKDPHNGIFVTECDDLLSTSCRQFISLSEKATLQWKLEMLLTEFERKYFH